jgi:arsenate reductase
MYTLYGIKNCDTVKKARLWLDQQKISYRFHDYRADGLDRALLLCFEAAFGWENLLNRKSTTWRQLAAEQQSGLDRNKAVELMLATPTLIKRPILEGDAKWLIGFNPETYQKEL